MKKRIIFLIIVITIIFGTFISIYCINHRKIDCSLHTYDRTAIYSFGTYIGKYKDDNDYGRTCIILNDYEKFMNDFKNHDGYIGKLYLSDYGRAKEEYDVVFVEGNYYAAYVNKDGLVLFSCQLGIDNYLFPFPSYTFAYREDDGKRDLDGYSFEFLTSFYSRYSDEIVTIIDETKTIIVTGYDEWKEEYASRLIISFDENGEGTFSFQL